MRILQIVARNGFMPVTAIAAATGVSEITVRRDLARLEGEGALQRTHGGAVLLDKTAEVEAGAFEPAFEARRRQNLEAKQRIGRTAAGLIGRGETVAIDVGTTALAFAEALAARDDLKVVTNNLRAARRLADTQNEVYVPGGRVRSREHAITGPIAVAALDGYWFDSAIIGVAGLTADGLYDYSPDDSEIKRAFMRRSRRVIVLADRSKLGRRAMVEVTPPPPAMTLVCNAPPDAELMAQLASRNVEIVIA
ncbi:MAG: DeoR/GlpR family DNA-binding transcription regulator [Hyphomicrobiaceae bacterium]